MRKLVQNLGLIGLATVIAFAVTAVGQGLWGGMVMLNAKLDPAFPWSALVMPFVLFALVAFLCGRGWPRWGAEARRALVPLAPVSAKVWAWSLISGVPALIVLAELWTVTGAIVRVPPNALTDPTGIPPITLAAFLLVSIVAAPLTEEIAFRGYAMGLLRRRFGAFGAIVISSIMFAAVHLTQGLYPTKLTVYLLVGLAFAIVVWRTRSLLPAMVLHSLGDLTFFTLVWPHDAGRKLISEGGADVWFFVNVAVLVIATPLWALALRQFFKVTEPPAGETGEARRAAAIA